MHKNASGLSTLHDPCLIPESRRFVRTLTRCSTWRSVYSVATNGEAVYFQQIFLGRSVFKSIPFQSRIGIDYFVIVSVWRGQECVWVALRECGGGALCHVGNLRIFWCHWDSSFVSRWFYLKESGRVCYMQQKNTKSAVASIGFEWCDTLT